ncbi:MAG: efflux transporter periplasmic adaptor subunit [Marinoscillum sp.]|nr:efflux transporter periplasmic adaptor subunit [Marinoscillum sp.]OUX26702.1 MAG: efflux transporter periplasmic adaptor subunit [Flammeovirgaceae bacterium TMED262]|tara:strand:- start:23203 stop:24525 length:1323 start_codon:yes stop_codon:yes gene_type:complete
MKNKVLVIAGSIIILLIVVSLVGRQMGWIGGIKPIEVETQLADLGSITELVTASGEIQPEVEVRVSPEVPGEIIELNIMEGEFVDEGKLLVKIRPDNFINALERAKANYNQVRANLSSSKSNLSRAEAQYLRANLEFDRQKKLFDQNVISDSEFELAETNFKVSKQDLESSKQSVIASEYVVRSALATVDEAEENLRKTSIIAPMTGTVSLLNVELGERVVGTSQMAGTELLRIANLSIMEVRVDVNENDIVRVEVDDIVNIDVDAYTTLNKKFTGVVTEIASTANPKPSADAVTEFKVKIRVLNESFRDLVEEEGIKNPFKPGMTASVEIITQEKNNILVVPISSVTTKTDKDSLGNEVINQVVFIEKDGEAEMVIVETGISDFDNIEILNGINGNENVIKGPYIAISQKLKDGSIVKIKDSEKGKSKDDSEVSLEVKF